MFVSSSMEIRLSSQTSTRFPSRCVPARLLASALTPSSRSPSEAMHQTVWSNGLCPGAASGSSRPRSRRAAIAMPTALPTPWPSGPVVVSTPGVWPCSGWPGGQRAPLPQVREVLQRQAVAGQEQLRVQRDAGVAAGQHEAVAARPSRGRTGRGAGSAGTAAWRRARGSSPCRGGRSRRPRRRPWPARGRRRRCGGRGRTSRGRKVLSLNAGLSREAVGRRSVILVRTLPGRALPAPAEPAGPAGRLAVRCARRHTRGAEPAGPTRGPAGRLAA